MTLLVAEGLQKCDIVLDPVLPVGARRFSLAMVQRSKRYFEALVDAETLLFARGVPRIEHHKPEAYYACLYKVEDVVALHALPGFDVMGNRAFVRILETGVLGAADPADAAMLADDDRPDVLEGLLAIEDADLDDAVRPVAVHVAAGMGVDDVAAGLDMALRL